MVSVGTYVRYNVLLILYFVQGNYEVDCSRREVISFLTSFTKVLNVQPHQSVWPDLAKFRHLGNFLWGLFGIGQCFDSSLAIFHCGNCPNMEHLVTLLIINAATRLQLESIRGSKQVNFVNQNLCHWWRQWSAQAFAKIFCVSLTQVVSIECVNNRRWR